LVTGASGGIEEEGTERAGPETGWGKTGEKKGATPTKYEHIRPVLKWHAINENRKGKHRKEKMFSTRAKLRNGKKDGGSKEKGVKKQGLRNGKKTGEKRKKRVLGINSGRGLCARRKIKAPLKVKRGKRGGRHGKKKKENPGKIMAAVT